MLLSFFGFVWLLSVDVAVIFKFVRLLSSVHVAVVFGFVWLLSVDVAVIFGFVWLLSSVHVAVVFGFVWLLSVDVAVIFPQQGGRDDSLHSRAASEHGELYQLQPQHFQCARHPHGAGWPGVHLAGLRLRHWWGLELGLLIILFLQFFFLFLSVVMIVVHVLYCLTEINISWQGRSTQVQEQSCWPCHYRAEVLLNTDMNWRGWWQGSCWGGGVECFVHHHSSCWHSTACFIDTFSWWTHFVTCAVDIANLFHWSSVWNNHPSSVWHVQTLPSFKSQLKTRLFSISYS